MILFNAGKGKKLIAHVNTNCGTLLEGCQCILILRVASQCSWETAHVVKSVIMVIWIKLGLFVFLCIATVLLLFIVYNIEYIIVYSVPYVMLWTPKSSNTCRSERDLWIFSNRFVVCFSSKSEVFSSCGQEMDIQDFSSTWTIPRWCRIVMKSRVPKHYGCAVI